VPKGAGPPGRALEDRIVVAAPAEAVWRALTDAEELMRWFPLRATVEPGEGGTISLSWGESGTGIATIAIWEPSRRLRVLEQRRDAKGRLVEIAVDYFIEAAAASTTLRVVHSGFGPGAEWDEEYDGTARGWAYELRGLRHYLSWHAGEPRRVAQAAVRTASSPGACYARIMGLAGLARTGTLAGLREGEAYRIAGAAGVFEGQVLVNRPPLDFAGTVTNLNDALLRYEFYGGSTKLWLATWGLDEAVVRGLESRFQEIMVRAAGPASADPA
jgi:uncharacterized protein YndB with AHSA1/START domain